MNLNPLDDRVVVEPVEAEERTAGGIVLPDTAKEKPQRGKVLAVGPGKLLDSGKRGELSVQVGDQVIYGKYGGTDIEVNGDDVKLSGFGNFNIRRKAPRPGRNPRTGEAIPIKARNVVTFHASHKLKAIVQGDTPVGEEFE